MRLRRTGRSQSARPRKRLGCDPRCWRRTGTDPRLSSPIRARKCSRITGLPRPPTPETAGIAVAIATRATLETLLRLGPFLGRECGRPRQAPHSDAATRRDSRLQSQHWVGAGCLGLSPGVDALYSAHPAAEANMPFPVNVPSPVAEGTPGWDLRIRGRGPRTVVRAMIGAHSSAAADGSILRSRGPPAPRATNRSGRCRARAALVRRRGCAPQRRTPAGISPRAAG